MTDTYQNWVSRVVGGQNSKPLNSGEVVKSSSGEPFGAIEFVRVPKTKFLAEVGKKGDKYIYHLYPPEGYGPDSPHPMIRGPKTFYDLMSEAFLEIFKRADQIEADWVKEMGAWALRVSGWTNHVWGDELALRAVDRLDELIIGNRP